MACDDVIYEFKRGDTFKIPMRLTDPNNNNNPVDITGWAISAQVRKGRDLVTDLVINVVSAGGGQFELTRSAANTQNWPARRKDQKADLRNMLMCDVELVNDQGEKTSSQTFYIDCEEDISYVEAT